MLLKNKTKNDMKRVDLKELDQFTRIGYVYKKVFADNENHVYVFAMGENSGPIKKYEIVRGVRKIVNDVEMYVYPGTSQFGIYGFFITGNEEYVKERLLERYNYLISKKK